MTTWPFEDSFVVAYGAICSVASALTSKISIDRTGHQIRGVETAQLRPNPSDFLALLTSPKPFGRWLRRFREVTIPRPRRLILIRFSRHTRTRGFLLISRS